VGGTFPPPKREPLGGGGGGGGGTFPPPKREPILVGGTFPPRSNRLFPRSLVQRSAAVVPLRTGIVRERVIERGFWSEGLVGNER
jgi:hypothetical protein